MESHLISSVFKNKEDPPDVRCKNADLAIEKGVISIESILTWIMRQLGSDDAFTKSEVAWELFKNILESDQIEGKFSCTIKSYRLASRAIENQRTRALAFECLELIIKKYPLAWRPRFDELVDSLVECLNVPDDVFSPDEVHFFINLINVNHEFVAAGDAVFRKIREKNKHVFTKLLSRSDVDGINEDIIFTFLANAICVPFFVQKATNDMKGDEVSSLIDDLNKTNMTRNEKSEKSAAVRFAPYFVHSFFRQIKHLRTVKIDLSLPLEIIAKIQSLDIAVPILEVVCEENKTAEKIYSIEHQSSDFNKLKQLAERAIREKNGGVLSQLCKLDFRTVKPHLEVIMHDEEIATEDLCLSILTQSNLERNLLILFNCGNFPAHILAKEKFIQKYCEYVSFTVSAQITLLLNHLVGFCDNMEESALLFWTMLSAKLTSEHCDIIDRLVADCYQNPWRYTAAVIAAKKLRRQMPSPAPFVVDPDTNPVILRCFICEDFGTVTFSEWCNKHAVVPAIPYLDMDNGNVFRFGFIIENLPMMAGSMREDDLTLLLRFIVKKSIYATSTTEPRTIADYCLAVLNNSYFYESPIIKELFVEAMRPILPKRHFRSEQTVTPKLQALCAVVASMPEEFLSPETALCAFIGLFVSCETMLETPVIENEILSHISIIDAMCNVASILPISSVSHNMDRIFMNCPDDAIERLMPILFKSTQKLPDATPSKQSQVIAICEYCSELRIPLPFENLMYGDDIDAFCAQLKAGSQEAVEVLMSADISPDDVPRLMTAISQMSQSNAVEINKDFYSRLIECIVEVEKPFDAIIPFAQKLSSDLLVHFLDVAPVTFYPYILQQIRISPEKFESTISKYIIELVKSYPQPDVIKSVCTFKFAKFFDEEIIEWIILGIIMYSHRAENLADISILCSCVVQLVANCIREVNKFAPRVVEIVRNLSHTFAKRVISEQPTYRHLRAVSKMYATVSKTAGADYIQYLIASFVSHIAQVRLNDDKMMKLLQSGSFPLFDRCSKKQLSEVSVSLHDAHRQIFKQLHERWSRESQYTGKV